MQPQVLPGKSLAGMLLAALLVCFIQAQRAVTAGGPPPGAWFARPAFYNSSSCSGKPDVLPFFLALPMGVCFTPGPEANATYSFRGGPQQSFTSFILQCSDRNRAGAVGITGAEQTGNESFCEPPKPRFKLKDFCFKDDNFDPFGGRGDFPFAVKLSCQKMPNCRPQNSLTRDECMSRTRRCGRLSIQMKWTGRGCRSETNKALGDGGCQCLGYCGYKCSEACNADKECFWNTGSNECWSKVDNSTGQAIEDCINPPPNPGISNLGRLATKGLYNP